MKMKKVIIRSLIFSLIFEAVGAVINLVSFFANGEFLLATRLYGGEYMGQRGFGLQLNKVFPFGPVSNPSGIKTWISIDLMTLLAALAAGFILGFIIFFIVYLAGKRRNKNA